MQKVESIDFLQRIINSLKDYAIFSTDQNGILTHWSEGAMHVLGYEREEVIGLNASIFYTREDNENGIPQKEMATTLAKGAAIDERYHVKKGGALFWGSGLVYPLFDGNSNHIGFTKIMRSYTATQVRLNLKPRDSEISELKELMSIRELETSERRLSQVITSSKIGVWDLDPITGKAVTSLSHAEVLGYDHTKQEWGSDIFLRHVIPEDRLIAEKALAEAWKTGAINMEVRINKIDTGELRWVHVVGEVVTEDRSGRKRMMGMTTDVTDHKEKERRRDELITIVSHELKTPVTSMKAYLQLLGRKIAIAPDDPAAEMFNKIEIQISRLVMLITDLLDVSKIEGGHLQLKIEKYNFHDLLAEVVADVQKTTATHQIVLSDNPHVTITGDPERTRQVIINLLTNAIKYSPDAGQVIVKATTRRRELTCSVQDFGIGIPLNKQKRIFDRFYRVSDDPNYAVTGIGMGLYISSEIIMRLGGRMWFESVPDEGSTFSFSIPVNSAPRA
ncbi:MAG TPA: ATP-binding protein [Sphingobacteriaceae bacterium]